MNNLPPVYALCVTAERKATRQLSEIGIASWAPTYRRLKPKIRGVARSTERPLFPGYVFARLKPEDFAAAKATEYVFGVVSFAGTPIPLPEADWVRVLIMHMSGRFDERTPAKKALPRGCRNRSLAGMQAWFQTYAMAA